MPATTVMRMYTSVRGIFGLCSLCGDDSRDHTGVARARQRMVMLFSMSYDRSRPRKALPTASDLVCTCSFS